MPDSNPCLFRRCAYDRYREIDQPLYTRQGYAGVGPFFAQDETGRVLPMILAYVVDSQARIERKCEIPEQSSVGGACSERGLNPPCIILMMRCQLQGVQQSKHALDHDRIG